MLRKLIGPAMTGLASLALAAAVHAQQAQPVRLDGMMVVAGEVPPVSYIVGTATNTTNRVVSVFVHLNLYDARNVVVGNAVDHVANLGPGETWQFKAGATVPFHHVRVSEVKTFHE